MSYGSGWGGYPWGGGDPFVQSVEPVFYDIEIDETAIGLTSDVFIGLHQIPSIIVAAQSPTKVEVVFSVAMSIDSNFLNAASYTITQVEGSIQVPVLSVEASGPLPIQRVTLEIGTPLESKRYYFLNVSHSVISLTGDFSVPDYDRFQWKDQTTPIFRSPLEIPIQDFSGEVRGGILGQPDGLVFFSPAYDDVASTSTIELEQLSVCTLAYDSYEMPNPPDPAPLRTWGPGNTSVLGPTSVLWAPHDRLGLPRMDLKYEPHEAQFEPAYDLNLTAVLAETIDITKGGGFMNDLRWKTFPGTGATVFKTAANKTTIGPGPTTPLHLDWPKIHLSDSVSVTDQVILNAIDLEMQDDVEITENLTVQGITPGFIGILINETVALSSTIARQATYARQAADTITTTDSVTAAFAFSLNVVLSDTVATTDANIIKKFALVKLTFSETLVMTDDASAQKGTLYPVSVSDTLTTTDATIFSWVYGRSGADTLVTTDGNTVEIFGSNQVVLADTAVLTDSILRSVSWNKTLSDTLSTTDSPSNFTTKGVADTVSIADLGTRDMLATRTGSDTVAMTDSGARSLTGERTPSDTISTTDTVFIGNPGNVYDVTPSETLAVVDYVWSNAPVQYHDTTYSPVALWQFNGNVNDSSGNGLTLGVSGTSTESYADLYPGLKGIMFDGNQRVTVNQGLLKITGDMTIEMLLVYNPSSLTASSLIVQGASGESSGTNYLYSIAINDVSVGGLVWFSESGSGVDSSFTADTVTVPRKVLCHLAVTRTSNVIQFYLNGVPAGVASSALITPFDGNSGSFVVGDVGVNAPLCGIASLKIIASALTSTQILGEYNRTMGRAFGER